VIWRRIIFWLGAALVIGGLVVEMQVIPAVWRGDCPPCHPHEVCLAIACTNPRPIAVVAGGVMALGILMLLVARLHRVPAN
jgi:hypothetical protein